MEPQFSKHDKVFYQEMSIDIMAIRDIIFRYLASKDVTNWFPQLSFEDDYFLFKSPGVENIVMPILENNPFEKLRFSWGNGDVTFTLIEKETVTELLFDQKLTSDIDDVANDFAGWYFQLENIKSITETQEPKFLNMDHFEQRYKETKNQLKCL